MQILTPTDAVVAAACFLRDNWIHGCNIATTPSSFSVDSGNANYVWYVFECGEPAGGRWLIGATRYGIVCHVSTESIEDLKRAAQEQSDENERKLREARD